MGRQYFKSLVGIIALTFCPTAITLSGWQLARAQSNQESLVAIEFPAATPAAARAARAAAAEALAEIPAWLKKLWN